MRRILIVTVLALACGGSPAALAADPVAYVTELHGQRGGVRVQSAGAGDAPPAQPLMPLHAGDRIRVTGDGRAVVLFHAGTVQVVTLDNSPYTVTPPPGPAASERLQAAMHSIAHALLGRPEPPTTRRLSVRGSDEPPGGAPVILAPRHSRVMPGGVVFEWRDDHAGSHEIRVSGSDGAVVWQRAGIARSPVAYPDTGRRLAEATRYVWELSTPGRPTQAAQFEIVSSAEAARIQAELAELGRGLRGTSLVVARAAYLFDQGLFGDARRELEAATRSDPREPGGWLLLGRVYDQVGLGPQADDAYERVRSLLAER
ncbi:MAG: hypothetical protein HY294_08245 [Candidatus Rokubacteria bacterium]|nr:hypothetical protein [Candidatus Rokubacteria bacterium]